jgi:hypothetical protein
MVDEFENSTVPFNDALAQRIKTSIRQKLGEVQEGSQEHLEGLDRAKFLLNAGKLSGLELKRLKNYIDTLPRDSEGRPTNPAYYLIGGDALHTFVMDAIKRLRDLINKGKENQEELGKTEKQDVKPPKPNLEKTTGFPHIHLELTEQVKRIKQLIQY